MHGRAILALTNGLATSKDVSESTKLRLIKAASVFQSGDIIITSTGYTVNKKPFLDSNGFPVLEAVIAARYLVENFRVAQSDVIAESFSRDTIGNLFLAFQMVILPLQVSNVLIVTSAFHVPRVKAIMALLTSVFDRFNLSVEYIQAKDPHFEAAVKAAMEERELTSIQNIQNLKTKVITSEAFTRWFYNEHRAYGYTLDPAPADEIIQKAY